VCVCVVCVSVCDENLWCLCACGFFVCVIFFCVFAGVCV